MSDISEALRENKRLIFPVKQSSKSRSMGKIRYWWCWLVAAAMLIIVATPSLVFFWLINRRHWLYPLARWGAAVWLKAAGAQLSVSGAENLEPDRSYVFISNHRSYLDTVVLFAYTGKQMGIVAKKELLKVPILGQGMSFVNVIAIDRSNADRARRSMEKAKNVMECGYSFGVFAEGTRAVPGELLPFKKGAFHLAMQTGVDIVPVAIRNTDRMMGKKTRVAYPGTIEMILLPPIETRDQEVAELLTKTRAVIAEELARES
jgi:1-acyl-sn-glycerol-3-phosphate acyltransferase